jgi:hypothetical protein
MKLLQNQMNTLVLFVLFCLLSTANAQESITGADSLIKRIETPTRDACYIYRRYIVMFPYLDPNKIQDAEENLMVFKKRSDDNDLNCSLPKKEQELLRIESGAFFGLYRHFVFTESGTGPDGRGIAIYDLEKKKMVYSANYSPIGVPRIENNALIFYKDFSDLRYKEYRHCPDAEKWLRDSGLDYGFEQKTKLDLGVCRT